MKKVLLLIFLVSICATIANAQVNSQRVIYTASNPPTACVAGKIYTNPALSPAKAWVGTSAGTCTEIDSSAAAPIGATYITETANSSLTNEFALGSLATGILKNTTTTGIPSIAVAGDFPTLNQNTTGTAANLSGTPALPNGTAATTQPQADNSTRLATTAYVDTLGATKQNSLGFTAENSANKNATGGYAGLTLFQINFKNAANTFTSFFTNANTAARTYTFQDSDDTIVGRATTDELTNKTLNASVGKGTWTASGTWTLPAHTFGGTVSGGGNQLNNIIVGTTTPLAGSFTTLVGSTSTKTPIIFPASDSTTALKLTKADASTAVVTVDTTNAKFGINGTPTVTLHVLGGSGNNTPIARFGRSDDLVAASIISAIDSANTMWLGTVTNHNMLFGTNSTVQITLSTVGNLKLAGTVSRGTTEGTNHFDIFDGTAPAGTLANGISLYSTSGELRVMDAAGNATLLSPHDHETNEWIFYSVNTVTGKTVKIDMERMMRALDVKLGGGFVHDYIGEANARPDLRKAVN